VEIIHGFWMPGGEEALQASRDLVLFYLREHPHERKETICVVCGERGLYNGGMYLLGMAYGVRYVLEDKYPGFMYVRKF
jgi:hypothetical protein